VTDTSASPSRTVAGALIAGTDRVLSFADFGLRAAPQDLTLTIAALPGTGALVLLGTDATRTPVAIGQEIAWNDIAGGRLIYRPDPAVAVGDHAEIGLEIAAAPGTMPGGDDIQQVTALLDVHTQASDTVARRVTGTTGLSVGAGTALTTSASAITWNTALTGAIIDNAGTIRATAVDARAINASGVVTLEMTVTLTNRAGALIQSANDAFRINRDITTTGTVSVDNAGTILSTTSGQALDFDAIASTAAGQVRIVNQASGVIRALAADAIRPGQNALVDNAGLIWAGGIVGDKNDGIDLQLRVATIHNREGGLISGQRHGITTDTDLTVFNDAGGVIIGRNGSGVGSDGNGRVVNHGRITGAYDGNGIGDGDGVDIDGYGLIDNYGIIEGTGAAGPGNGAEGALATGGGIINNHVGATITGIVRGVTTGNGTVVNNDGRITATGPADTVEAADGLGGMGGGALVNSATGVVNGTKRGMFVDGGFAIDNAGSIEGGEQGVLLLGAAVNTVVNSGRIAGGFSALQAQGGTNTITSDGVLAGGRYGILLEAGTNVIDLLTGSHVSGVSGGIAAIGTSTNAIANAGIVTGGIRLNDGADTLTNSGSITGPVRLGAGDDTFTWVTGSAVDGVIDGQGGDDRFVIAGSGDVTLAADRIVGFEQLIQRGSGIVSYAGTFDAHTILIEHGTLAVATGETLATVGTTAITGDAQGVTIAIAGTIVGDIALGSGDDTVVHHGLLTGAVSLGAGADTFTLYDGARIGTVDGGDGTDAFVVSVDHEEMIDGATLTGFETLTQRGSGIVRYAGTFTMDTIALEGGTASVAHGDVVATAGTIAMTGGGQGVAIVNHGTIAGAIALGAGDDALTSSGAIAGAVDMGDGNDTLRLTTGFDLQAPVTGGDGDDTLAFELDADDTVRWTGMQASGFEHLSVAGAGTLVLADDAFAFDTVSVSGTLEIAAGAGLSTSRVVLQAGDSRLVLAGTVAATIDGGTGHGTLDLSQLSHGATVVDWRDNHDRGAIDLTNVGGIVGSDHDDVFVMIDNVAGVRLSAGAGNDILIGGGGDDVLDGGSGIDRTSYHAFSREATLTRDGSDLRVMTQAGGNDLLHSVEYIQFRDGYFTNSATSNAARVVGAYRAVAGRGPDGAELNAGTASLDKGGTLAALVRTLSQADDRLGIHADTSNAAFVSGLYSDLLGRTVDPAGLDYWVAVLDRGKPRERVVANIIAGAEYGALTAADFHGAFIADASAQTLLTLYHAFGRLPDQDGFNHWLGQLSAGRITARGLTDLFATSSEWSERTGALSNGDLVEHLYLTALDRQGDGGGRNFWTAALDNGLSRADLFEAFAWSPEHKELMNRQTYAGMAAVGDLIGG